MTHASDRGRSSKAIAARPNSMPTKPVVNARRNTLCHVAFGLSFWKNLTEALRRSATGWDEVAVWNILSVFAVRSLPAVSTLHVMTVGEASMVRADPLSRRKAVSSYGAPQVEGGVFQLPSGFAPDGSRGLRGSTTSARASG